MRRVIPFTVIEACPKLVVVNSDTWHRYTSSAASVSVTVKVLLPTRLVLFSLVITTPGSPLTSSISVPVGPLNQENLLVPAVSEMAMQFKKTTLYGVRSRMVSERGCTCTSSEGSTRGKKLGMLTVW